METGWCRKTHFDQMYESQAFHSSLRKIDKELDAQFTKLDGLFGRSGRLIQDFEQSEGAHLSLCFRHYLSCCGDL